MRSKTGAEFWEWTLDDNDRTGGITGGQLHLPPAESEVGHFIATWIRQIPKAEPNLAKSTQFVNVKVTKN